MSFSDLYLSRTSGVPDYFIRSAQAADAEEMARVVALHLAEIVAMNAAIQGDENKFTPVDASLAAAGDGHTFIFTVYFTRASIAAVQNLLVGESSALPLSPAAVFLDPALFLTKFAVAAEQDAVDAALNKAVSDILDAAAGTPGGDATVLCNFVAVAGSAKGQRFMVAVTGLVPPPQIT
jgi:hypothetical protein